jgi:hypothetical protein
MISDTTAREAFSSEVPGLQFAFDSVSLGLLKECPRKYQYTILEGWIPAQESVHLTFGLHYHKAIEIYDHRRASRDSHDDALDTAVAYCLQSTITRLPTGKWRPWISDDPNKNRATLLRSVVWYLDQFADDAATTVLLDNGKPAVELSFRFEIPVSVGNQRALLCGHLDRLVSFNSQIWAMDHKTTKYSLSNDWFSLFNPDNQMTLYTLASQVVYNQPVKGVIISGAQILATLTRFQRGFTTRHREELDEWLEEAGWYIKLGEAYARKGFWPKNDKSCGHYGGCSFRSICSAAPAMRETLLQASFTRRPWDPLLTRGDI